MTDIERAQAYEAYMRRRIVGNYLIRIGNLGIGTFAAGTGPEEDVDMGSTVFIFSDGSTKTFDFKGDISYFTMIDEGIVDQENNSWTISPVRIEIGTDVTGILNGAFSECPMESVKIPRSVTSLGEGAF